MITFLLGLHLEPYSVRPGLYAWRLCTASITQTINYQQRKIYPNEPGRLLRIQAQDRRCTV